MPNPNEIDITVVVNGQPTTVAGNVHAALRTIIPRALEQTGNVGQPVENWELRDTAGQVLDGDRKLSELGLATGATLFLNLKAGVGG